MPAVQGWNLGDAGRFELLGQDHQRRHHDQSGRSWCVLHWIKVDAVAGANSFTIDQDITSLNFGTYFAKASGSALWTSSCTKVNSALITQDGYPTDGDVTVSFNASSAGTYIIGIKYDSGSVKGVAPPTGSGIAHYTFSVNGTGTQGLDLKPKP